MGCGALAVLEHEAHPKLSSPLPQSECFSCHRCHPVTDHEMQADQCFVNMSRATAFVGVGHCLWSAVPRRARNARRCSVPTLWSRAQMCTRMRDGGPLRTLATEVFRRTVSILFPWRCFEKKRGIPVLLIRHLPCSLCCILWFQLKTVARWRVFFSPTLLSDLTFSDHRAATGAAPPPIVPARRVC